VTDPAAALPAYPPFLDPVATDTQQVRYSYWPVAFQNGDMVVISNQPLPLSGVKFSQVMRGVGELKGFLQLADDEVRALNPWDKVVPRKTGIVVVREYMEPVSGEWIGQAVWGGIVWKAPRNPHTGRMEITAQTTESLWARRLITRAMAWSGQDQTTIAADLLDPAKFSLIPLGGGLWRGWITVDPPTVFTGVARTHHYDEGQETNLLEAHQARSQLATNSYEWTTSIRLLSGETPASASSFRVRYDMGFPKLGRELGDVYPVPRLTYDTGGSGNVIGFGFTDDGGNTPNIVWGRGSGYEDLQTKTQVQNNDVNGVPEWSYGFLQTEARFSDADVSQVSTLTDYCYRYMWERLGSEKFITSLSVRGDQPPYFGTYGMGDQVVLETNDVTWPTDWYQASGFVELLTRLYGWTVTPPQGEASELVEMLLSGGALSDDA
jgi:hypothetical protein